MRSRKLFSLIISLTAAFTLFFFYSNEEISISKALFDYYAANHISDTSAANMVSAIYLNYRFFDTLLETLTLLVSVIGIIYFSRHSLGEKEDEKKF